VRTDYYFQPIKFRTARKSPKLTKREAQTKMLHLLKQKAVEIGGDVNDAVRWYQQNKPGVLAGYVENQRRPENASQIR